jgi:hypothetical protein
MWFLKKYSPRQEEWRNRMWTFDPTTKLRDFDRVPGLRAAWSDMINEAYETHLYGKPNDRVQSAPEELRLWGRSASDLRVYNPASMPMPTTSEPKNVTWSALPTSFDDQFNTVREKLAFLDARQPFPAEPSLITRIQDEGIPPAIAKQPGCLNNLGHGQILERRHVGT